MDPASDWDTGATELPVRGGRGADGKGGNWTEAIGFADDYEDANGHTILDFWQAQDKARARAADARGAGPKAPATGRKRSKTTRRTIKARSGDTSNVSRLRAHSSRPLLDKVVAALTFCIAGNLPRG